jgi:hypothetical protein
MDITSFHSACHILSLENAEFKRASSATIRRPKIHRYIGSMTITARAGFVSTKILDKMVYIEHIIKCPEPTMTTAQSMHSRPARSAKVYTALLYRNRDCCTRALTPRTALIGSHHHFELHFPTPFPPNPTQKVINIFSTSSIEAQQQK